MKRGVAWRARERVFATWRRLTGSLWFLPGIIALATGALAVLLIELSTLVDDELLTSYPRVFGVTAEGSRSVLATIAGSVVTVAGVTFSILVVAVSQASSQFTPRVLRNFMRDRQSQLALGVLMGVFVYCLVVIRTIRSEGEDPFVPAIAVLAAFVLAIIAVGWIMYFIHHIASTLEPGSVLENVHRDAVGAVDRLFPQPLGAGAERAEHVDVDRLEWRAVPARCVGYVQSVDSDGMLHLAEERSLVLRMERGPGDFVFDGGPLASVASAIVDDDLIDAINGLYMVESYRTAYQDFEFGVRQMVDMALKALSPGINDPTTAAKCIHYMTAVLARFAQRSTPSPYRCIEGALRVIARGPTFESVLDLAFDELRRAADDNPRMLEALLVALEDIAAATGSPERVQAVLRHVDLIREAGGESIATRTESDAFARACGGSRERISALPIDHKMR